MKHQQYNPIGKILLRGLFGIVWWLIVIIMLNMLAVTITNGIYQQFVAWINSNIILVIIFSIIFLAGNIFDHLVFPFNLPAPVINAIGSLFFLTFFFDIFRFVDSVTGTLIHPVFIAFSVIIYVMVFVIVIISGYFSIFARLFAPHCKEEPWKTEWRKGKADWHKERKEWKREHRKAHSHTWEEVGDEFREAVYDAFHGMRAKPKRKKK